MIFKKIAYLTQANADQIARNGTIVANTAFMIWKMI